MTLKQLTDEALKFLNENKGTDAVITAEIKIVVGQTFADSEVVISEPIKFEYRIDN